MNNITLQTYEDPEVVQAFINKNSLVPKQADLIKEFAKKIQGKRVLDLGCGPGHDSYIFADLGFEVTGLDFSNEMIRQAKKLKKTQIVPTFKVGDMTTLPSLFKENYFDAVWASASLLHIQPKDIAAVLKGISYISKYNSPVFISLKQGHGTKIVKEDVYAPGRERQFTFWQQNEFVEKASSVELVLEEVKNRVGRKFNNGYTQWFQFFFVNKKSV